MPANLLRIIEALLVYWKGKKIPIENAWSLTPFKTLDQECYP